MVEAAARPPSVLASIPEGDLSIDLSPTGLLGEGSFGIVRRGLWRGTPIAVKSLQRDASEVGEGPALDFEREMQVLARLRHPNVVPVFGVCLHADGRLSLVEELETGGTLYRRLHPARELSTAAAAAAVPQAPVRLGIADIAKVGLDVARGLSAAHAASVSHNDIKSGNVLFNAGGAAVLADFGSAKRVRNALPNTMQAILGTLRGGGGTAGGLLGTPNWTAPENLNEEGEQYGQPPGDVYSFGMLLYEMATGAIPWGAKSIMAIADNVRAGKRPPVPEGVDPKVRSLFERCWAQNTAARPTAAAIVSELAELHSRVQADGPADTATFAPPPG